jgi:D-amino-acid dehydrogenase
LVLKTGVEDFVQENGALTGVRAGGETISCDGAVLAAGAWSKPLAQTLGLNIPLESERGYHLELLEPNIMPRSPIMIASGRFVATPMDGRLRLAGILEFGGLVAPASRPPIALLQKNIEWAIPGIRWKETRQWMGHRPAPADSIPVIGKVPGTKNAYLAFGHHHVGLTGGAKTGKLLSQLIMQQKLDTDLAPYAPSRFQ